MKIILTTISLVFLTNFAAASVVVLGTEDHPGGWMGISAPDPSKTPSFGYFYAQPFTLNQSLQITTANLGLWGKGTYPMRFQLTDLLGPDAAASNVIVDTQGMFPHPTHTSDGPAVFEWVSWNINQTLNAGTYFIVVSSTTLGGLDFGWNAGIPIPSEFGEFAEPWVATNNPDWRPDASITTIENPYANTFVPLNPASSFTFSLELSAVPEPTSLVLTMLASGVLLIRRKR